MLTFLLHILLTNYLERLCIYKLILQFNTKLYDNELYTEKYEIFVLSV